MYKRINPKAGPLAIRAALRRAAFGSAAAISLVTLAPGGSSAQTPPTSPATTSVGVNLNITPKRLTFNRNTRSASVYIFNQGTTAATFDISLSDRAMLPTGDIREVAEVQKLPEAAAILSKLNSAKAMIRATPRRATLAPGKGQTIRILVTPPADASSAGEYRTHLTVTTLPPRDAGMTAEQAASQRPGELSFRIQTVFGISIPLIVRTTPAQVQAAIENPKLIFMDIVRTPGSPAQRTPVVAFDLARSGTGSLFGNIEVRGGTGKDPIGVARGVGVYPEIDRRAVKIPLDRVPRPGEQLSITFTDDDVKPGNVAARSSLTVS